MAKRMLLMVVVLCCAGGNGGLLLAQSHPGSHVGPSQTKVIIFIGAGAAGGARTDQFEYAVAVAVGPDESGDDMTAGLFRAEFLSSMDGIETVDFGEISEAKVITDRETGRARAELVGTANVKLLRDRRYPRVPAIVILSEDSVMLALDLGRDGVVECEGDVFSGGNHLAQFVPESLVIALGGGSTVPSVFQAAVAIGDEGQAIGQLSLLANPDNGNQVRVDGLVDVAAVGDSSSGLPTGKRQHRPLRLLMSGMAAVDVFRPDGSSPDTCFGDFTFVANEGPHGPFRIDIPDCRDPAAGIEGTDVGTAAIAISEMTWPPVERDRGRSPR